MTQDRRRYPRLIPDTALLVSVDKLRRGFLSDLSEGGIAFDGLMARNSPNVTSLAFDLPEGGGLIEGIAEVVWTCGSRHRTGVRFLKLAEASRQHLRQWLSARVVTLDRRQEGPAPWNSASGITGAAQKWMLQEISDGEASEQVSNEMSKVQKSGGTGEAAKGRTSYPVIGLAAGLVIVCSAFVALGYYLPAWVPAPKASGRISTSESPVGFYPNGSIAPVSRVSGTARAATKDEGFVLQVGAMARKENADALAERLRRLSFPAFVFDRGSDGLYRVDVGPYPDADYAHDVRDELASAGFKTVLKRRLAR